MLGGEVIHKRDGLLYGENLLELGLSQMRILDIWLEIGCIVHFVFGSGMNGYFHSK